MAYFQDGTESKILDEECRSCVLGQGTCPIYLAQCLFNFEQMQDGQERLMQILHLLIDDGGICQVKKLMANKVELRHGEKGLRTEEQLVTKPGSEIAAADAGKRLPVEQQKIRVVLADDHPQLRQSLSYLLEVHSDIMIIGEAADGEEAANMARCLQPDVILMDVKMPKMDGIEATKVIHSEFPHIRIIGLSNFSEEEIEKDILDAGAATFMQKGEPVNTLLTAIRVGA